MLSYESYPEFDPVNEIVTWLMDTDWGHAIVVVACLLVVSALVIGLYVAIIHYVWAPFSEKHQICISRGHKHTRVSWVVWRGKALQPTPAAKPTPSKPAESTWDGFVVQMDDPDVWLRSLSEQQADEPLQKEPAPEDVAAVMNGFERLLKGH